MKLIKNKEEALIGVQEDVFALYSASKVLKNDKEVVLAAVRQNESSLYFSSHELRIIIGDNNPIEKLKELIQIEQDKSTLKLKISNQKIKKKSNKVVKL